MSFIRKNFVAVCLLCVLGIFLLAWWLALWLSSVAQDDARFALASKNLDGVAVSEMIGSNGYGTDGLNLALEGPASLKKAALAAVGAGDSADDVIYKTSVDDTRKIEPETPVEPEPEPKVVEPAPPPPTVEEIEKVNTDLNELFALEPIQFSSGSADIRPQSYSTLNEAARILGLFPTVELLVVGHTDSSGNAEENLKLSQSRAQSVVNYLRAEGVKRSQLHAEGRGETELLINPERSAEDKQKNRRINWERKQ